MFSGVRRTPRGGRSPRRGRPRPRRSLAALEVDVFEAVASTKGDVAIVLSDTATDTNVSLLLDGVEADALRDGIDDALRSGRTVEP